MDKDILFTPRRFHGVMVSSTFTDLKDHRAALIKAIKSHGMTDVAMENDSAKLADIIDSSLQMVRDSAAYIGVLSKKYGQAPKCPHRNPDNLSITELEFNEALRLERPILLFIMGKEHLLREENIETNIKKKKQLTAFTERAKKINGTAVNRIYATFDSLEDFKEKISHSVATLRSFLEETPTDLGDTKTVTVIVQEPNPIPKPPGLYAEPPYIGSHEFVGRVAQLETLDDWAKAANPNNILLFEAIGGNGKSMLTWEWTTKYSIKSRQDWAGIFWYSFYEKGAVMADFCQRALAYMTSQPIENFRKKKVQQLKELLLHHLKDKPWLFILDGLERVLVAYHRIDAAMVPDEELNSPTDKIVNRDPCSCINDEDDELLRALASASPSKILITSRLVPHVLINKSNQAIQGVRRYLLPGLRPSDAEQLLRNCGITGDSDAIQNYLTTNCDCHPLTIGVLAGLVINYFPDKGNFDAWIKDPTGGGKLNLASLDLIQRRNHILKAGFDALSEKSRQLLSAMALLSEAVEYPVLQAINPHIPPEPEYVRQPTDPQESYYWEYNDEEKKKQLLDRYQADVAMWKAYEEKLEQWAQLSEHYSAPLNLQKSIHELDQSGLLQYDKQTKRYDLHPVVRGVAKGELSREKKIELGLRAYNHFASLSQNPYEQAQDLDDIRVGINMFKMLLAIEYYQHAYNLLSDELGDPLFVNLEAYNEVLRLTKPFFLNGWEELPSTLDKKEGAILANDVGIALNEVGQFVAGLKLFNTSITAAIQESNYKEVVVTVSNVIANLFDQNKLGTIDRISKLSQEVCECWGGNSDKFRHHMQTFQLYSRIGEFEKAEISWTNLDSMGRDWPRRTYKPGIAELHYAWYLFWKGALNEQYIAKVEQLARVGSSRLVLRELHRLNGIWCVERGEYDSAIYSLNEAVRMARIIGVVDFIAETWLALAKHKLNQLADPEYSAEELSRVPFPAYWPLAKLWMAIGNLKKAKEYALMAYKWAWASGEPYVNRYELIKATELLNQLNTPTPNLPVFDLVRDEELTWEESLMASLEEEKKGDADDYL